MEGSSQNGIQSTQQQQAAASVINSGANMYEPIAPQQPIQFQNIAGPGQTFVNENPQPALQQHVQLQNITEQGQTSFIANPPQPYYDGKLYQQDPTKMAYATLPMQQYPTYDMPQPYGGNYYSTPQQPSTVIQQPPTAVPVSTAVQTSSGDNYITLSTLMTCLVLITGGWPSLLCTIAALFMSYNARDDEKRGNIAAARTKANISLGLNIAAVVFVVVMWSVVAFPVAVTVSAQTSAAQLPTSTPTPYCYSTQNPSYCSTQNCYYGSYTYYNYYYYYSYYYSYTYYYYSCLYSAYYSYSSYSYNSYSYNYYYSQYCLPSYSLTCSPNG